MPIRFACPHCSQKLSVSTRKAGKGANCPRCKKEITVPTPESASKSGILGDKAQPTVAIEEGTNEDDPYAQFVVYDDTELVYDDSSHPSAVAAGPTAADRVAVPRYVLYTQGVLLGGVALVSFIFGVLTGGTFFNTAATTASGPCTVSGTVRYATGSRTLPDEGAVILALPQTKDPGQRAATAGLRPDEPLPEEPLPGVEQIKNLGGAYARADQQGRFELRLESGGKYYFLVLSNHSRRSGDQIVKTDDIARLGRFLDDANGFLADSRYQFTPETIRGDRNYSALFD